MTIQETLNERDCLGVIFKVPQEDWSEPPGEGGRGGNAVQGSYRVPHAADCGSVLRFPELGLRRCRGPPGGVEFVWI